MQVTCPLQFGTLLIERNPRATRPEDEYTLHPVEDGHSLVYYRETGG